MLNITQERERAIDNTASAAQHAELVERINQLNILRESNVTLRTECESASKKARDLEAKLKELSQELEPAKEQARSAQAELNVTKIQMERLDGESRRWQERNAQLLSKVCCNTFMKLYGLLIFFKMKYDRIDPAKVQALNDEITSLKAEAASAEAKQKEAESSAEAQASRVCGGYILLCSTPVLTDILGCRIRGQLPEPQRDVYEKYSTVPN